MGTAECNSCKEGLSEEEYCKKAPSDVFGPVQGCEKYNCCKGHHARCNSCKEGLSEEEYCKKSLPRVPPGCNREGCCKTFSAKCRACNRGMSKEVFCKKKPKAPGCERNFHDCKKDPSASGCKWIKCCRKFTSKCFACAPDKSEEEVCRIMVSQVARSLADGLGSIGTVWMPLVFPSHPRSAWSPFLERFFGDSFQVHVY